MANPKRLKKLADDLKETAAKMSELLREAHGTSLVTTVNTRSAVELPVEGQPIDPMAGMMGGGKPYAIEVTTSVDPSTLEA